jgi:hypothetical protein
MHFFKKYIFENKYLWMFLSVIFFTLCAETAVVSFMVKNWTIMAINATAALLNGYMFFRILKYWKPWKK